MLRQWSGYGRGRSSFGAVDGAFFAIVDSGVRGGSLRLGVALTLSSSLVALVIFVGEYGDEANVQARVAEIQQITPASTRHVDGGIVSVVPSTREMMNTIAENHSFRVTFCHHQYMWSSIGRHPASWARSGELRSKLLY